MFVQNVKTMHSYNSNAVDVYIKLIIGVEYMDLLKGFVILLCIQYR